METITDLLSSKIVNFAKLPQGNPTDLKNFQAYQITPVDHDYPAKSPIMWNAVYQSLGLPFGYIFMVSPISQLEKLLAAFRADPKYLGGGAGVGYKVEVMTYLDKVDALAKAMGAVNVIVKENGRLVGYNTDGLGFAQSLAERFIARGQSIKGKKIVILGAGGAGNAIVFALAQMGARLVVLNRTAVKAKNLADKINAYFNLSGETATRFASEDEAMIETRNADAIVNVSTKGSAGELERYSALAPAILPNTEENVANNLTMAKKIWSAVPKTAIIGEIVLVNGLTPLLAQAKEFGFEILDGNPMVINQAVEAFWLIHQEIMEAKGINKLTIKNIMAEAAK